jgi:hypothetical protein
MNPDPSLVLPGISERSHNRVVQADRGQKDLAWTAALIIQSPASTAPIEPAL